MKVAVIGAGASGLFCAGLLASYGCKVDLFEANEKVGKKLYITGKGRCNVTNASDPNDVLNNVVSNSKFLYGALYNFTSYQTMEFFESLGVPLKVERGNRVFPESDKSNDIIKALERFNVKNGVNIKLNVKVEKIEKNTEFFSIITKCGVFNDYTHTIICVGGKTYSATGSNGDGYNFAKKFGHNVTEIRPALVPIVLKDDYIKQIEGLSLKNVKLISKVNEKPFKEFFGEMLFTANGISGPIVLTTSSYINKQDNISLYIDFKPALTEEQVINRINRDIQELKNSQVKTLMEGILPKRFVPIFLEKINIDILRKNKTLNTKEIMKIALNLKSFAIQYKGLDRLDFGIITSGGVDVKEINPKTMESKFIKNLYFCGEVLDVDALTGGFNLQIAFSTAYAAAQAIKGELI